MAEAVVVGVRVRPFNDREKGLNAEVCIDMDGPVTSITNPKQEGAEPQIFTFDESFWSHDGFDNIDGYSTAQPGSKYADQAYVYETFGKRVLDNAWAGYHCCLFAYGQTGAGKSYSMVGYGKNKGIVPISCEEIFSRITANTIAEKHYEVVCSMIEIYNEAVQDLLIDTEERPKKGLEIRESKLLGIYIDGVTKRPVDSYEAIDKTIEEATENRTVGSTLMNATSSRAHTVVIIEFKQVEKLGGKESVKVSMINLIDLAGSEKAGQTGATGDRLKEGSAINKSLSALGNVIEKLAQKSMGKKSVIVPYRDSKLTRLLQNALGGSSKTIMVCALSPASSNYEETLSTLRYADRAKKIKNNAAVNENPQEKLLRELKEENARLMELMEKMKQDLGVGEKHDLAVELNEKVAEIKAAEAILNQDSWEDRLAEAKEQEHEHDMQKASQSRRASDKRSPSRINVLAQKEYPHLINLNEDQLLTGRIKHKFPSGSTTKFGSVDRANSDDENPGDDEDDENSDMEEDRPDVELRGDGVVPKHCEVTNIGDKCYINSHSKGKGLEQTFVNGVSVAVLLKAAADDAAEAAKEADNQDGGTAAETPPAGPAGVMLQHGDRVAFGVTLFAFVDPEMGLAEMLIMSGQVNYNMARQELTKNQWKNAGLKFMRGMKMAKIFGGKDKDLSKMMMKRMSQVNSEDVPAAEEPLEESESEEDFEAALAKRDRKYERMVEAKDREIAELRLQLSAAGAGGGVATGKSAQLMGKSKQIKSELMTTLQGAIDAIETVEKRTRERVEARTGQK